MPAPNTDRLEVKVKLEPGASLADVLCSDGTGDHDLIVEGPGEATCVKCGLAFRFTPGPNWSPAMPATPPTLAELEKREKDIARSLQVGNRRIGRMNWATARWAAYMNSMDKLIAEQKIVRAAIAALRGKERG